MEEETKTFIGQGAWFIHNDPDLLLWWEGDQIRIDSIKGIEAAEKHNLPLTPLYLHSASLAWAQAAQWADEEDPR